MTNDLSRFDPVWRAAEPYMRARKNDVHLPLSFAWAQKLLDHYSKADSEICSLAIMLHDIGWYAIDMEQIISEGFRGENILQSDVRYQHEIEGVRLATEVLETLGWDRAIIAAVCEIIDGHDTRPVARNLNDRVVRDADKLWRYSVTGVAIAADWFGITPRAYVERLEQEHDTLETKYGRELAAGELATTRSALMLHVI